MALKKGFCTHCKGDEKLRIFGVNKDAEVCYCPNCMAAMQPKEAIANYRGLIIHYLKKASKALFESTQYLVAYQTFAHIIDINETIKVAHFGRVLSLVYLSSLRKSKIPFALALHKQEAPKWFHYTETVTEAFHFMGLLIYALDTYEARLRKRITLHNGPFYDIDCVILYLERLDEIREYKEFLISEANVFVENGKEQFKEIAERLERDKAHYVSAYKEVFHTVDGFTYTFQHFDNNRNPIGSIKNDNPVVTEPNKKNKKRKIELYPKDGKKSLIKDELFANNITLARLVNASVPVALVAFISALVLLVISFPIPNLVAKIILLVFASALVIISIVLFILHFVWKNEHNKKYYKGTNPFILK